MSKIIEEVKRGDKEDKKAWATRLLRTKLFTIKEIKRMVGLPTDVVEGLWRKCGKPTPLKVGEPKLAPTTINKPALPPKPPRKKSSHPMHQAAHEPTIDEIREGLNKIRRAQGLPDTKYGLTEDELPVEDDD